ncbi:MAG TPA: radical SAM protein [Chitinophagales bacterium]|nr:radical SAM protein [Chitinophagales bacterium]
MTSKQRILLLTPPFTQLNTPYPATAYLKGFLNTLHIEAHQADLGIEVILKLFSSGGLSKMFSFMETLDLELSENSYRVYALQREYLHTINPVIRFLQNKNPTLAHSICDRTYLPEASRFAQLEDLEWAFGTMGIQDRARHLATLYLEDLGDLITEAIDPHFGFSRYAERLGRTATYFDEIEQSLLTENSIITRFLDELLQQRIEKWQPTVVCLSVPFPGNLFGALKCGQFIKKNYPHIKIVLGGGYANTELRSLSDPRVFNYIDFVSLDDGEAPIRFLLEHLDGKREASQLKRIYACDNGKVVYYNGAKEKDVAQRETGTPDYSDFILDDYLSVIEVANPMHRLWSDGRWNKLTLAHGCYWGKCSFCDISLDYIKNYEPLTASIICDRIEEIIAQTNQNGFHFVDEAAPPALLRDVALEIIRRKITVTWWTNIRFEKSYTYDLTRLLKASGCIAVAGGLEVASDRLLAMMKKGVTVAQVARVSDAFTQAGIMVHAYLMYGFPTQTPQETIDALEMVRQLFLNEALQSGFWHRFAMTSHSPVGLNPAQFSVQRTGPHFGGFADNDLYHDDPKGANHDLFGAGLSKSLFNYMHGVGLDLPLKEWFDFKTPKTTVPSNYIEQSLHDGEGFIAKPTSLLVWLGNMPEVSFFDVQQGKATVQMAELDFYDKKKNWQLNLPANEAKWLAEVFPQLIPGSHAAVTYSAIRKSYEEKTGNSFDTLLQSKPWQQLRENGLLFL